MRAEIRVVPERQALCDVPSVKGWGDGKNPKQFYGSENRRCEALPS